MVFALLGEDNDEKVIWLEHLKGKPTLEELMIGVVVSALVSKKVQAFIEKSNRREETR